MFLFRIDMKSEKILVYCTNELRSLFSMILVNVSPMIAINMFKKTMLVRKVATTK